MELIKDVFFCVLTLVIIAIKVYRVFADPLTLILILTAGYLLLQGEVLLGAISGLGGLCVLMSKGLIDEYLPPPGQESKKQGG